jgi:xanthine dehydrogenase small subunit
MRKHILLFVNGQQHRVTGQDAFLTLSDFLRRRIKLCGTKIVCSEGDCGSCSVLCASDIKNASQNAQNTPLDYKSIDSCIRFMFQLDGCHIVTVEGLSVKGKLNGVQQAMIDCHGSQCGFCTPGFVVAMTGILEQKENPTTADWRHGLTGNLCRCTGYTSIVAAGEKANRQNTPSMESLYPMASLSPNLESATDEPVQIEAPNRFDPAVKNTVFLPRTLQQATEFLAKHPSAKIVAGATDVGVQFNKGHCDSQIWLDLNRVNEITGVKVSKNAIVAGARATWAELEAATQELAPPFHQIISIFGSPQIRNVGSIGGNIINASPIADSLPFLHVCEAELELISATGTRTVNINEFYFGYKQFDLKPGELLTKITIPVPANQEFLKLYKVSRRRDLDISSFTAAINIQCKGTQIQTAAIAYGAVGPVVLRLPKTESFLAGKSLTLETMKQAGDLAVQEITPISDVRGGVDFRLQLARNVLIKFFHETNSAGAPV